MRFARTIVLTAVGVLWWLLGPLVLLAALGLLLVPRVRAWMRPTRRVVLAWVATVAVLAGVVVLVPDGWLPIAPGPGRWGAPAYVGRPAGTQGVAGPIGESPTVTTRAYGVGDCERLVVGGEGRLVAMCGGEHPVLRLVDATSLRQRARTELPGAGCDGRLAAAGTQVVATSGQRVLVVDSDDLAIAASFDLAERLAADDCVVGLGVDGGRAWFVTAGGVAGVVAKGRVRTVELGDRVEQDLAVGNAGVYIAGDEALHRVGLRGDEPVVAWSSAYEEGGERGAAPVVLRSGLVAVADNRDPRLQVVLHRADTGEVKCRAEVFDDGSGAADGGLVAAGDDVVVTNAHGYAGPLSTILGRTTDRGVATVSADCAMRWTLELDVPSGAPAVSTDDGLVYVWSKRHSWLGVDAWYLSAIELRSGRLVWARRVGLNGLHDNHGGSVVLGPERAAYAPVLGGLVRVADRG
ncbi:hypothetical protein GON03_10735 [Nocardioides sp. MAH-18]|uniref:PQQ-binding-like beta-propeller repeat protein n=1 Tax=Nocardioides agri TaxID=2682843 RepID=A0A6L6XSR1_9ACTN|nr:MULTISPECIES: hypothetical protein [unclassified Nocardioides]MBA2954802.1 hypothetical protein [Nocardioides sp. CGMCC 1.13656]MVQ49657.1 hypothetical protein [Nocardioides sp. MAH-18]